MPIKSLFSSQRREFRRLISNSRDRLYTMAFAWTHDPYLADDIVQQAVCKALNNQKQLRDFSAAQSWLYRILANCLTDHIRSKRDFVSEDELVEIESRSPERLTQEGQLVGRVRFAISQLPLPQRQVVTLVDLEDFTYVTVSEILEIPVGTVMSRLCRGRKSLKNLLIDIRPNVSNEQITQLKSVKK